MQRTTLVLDNDLFRRLKAEAASSGSTIRDVVNMLLRRALALARARPSRRFRLRWKTVRGKLQPGVNLDDRGSLFELMGGR